MVSDLDTLDDIFSVNATMKHHLRHLAKEFNSSNILADINFPNILMSVSMKKICK